ncbi:MAG: tetratricopeptide repeat protein, partial [Myxococcales bacterium]|nr:tetratricopeptide repeat protein [Myxococcales bacterium]
QAPPVSGGESLRVPPIEMDRETLAREAAAWEEAAQELLSKMSQQVESAEDNSATTVAAPPAASTRHVATWPAIQGPGEEAGAPPSGTQQAPQEPMYHPTAEHEARWFDADPAAPPSPGSQPFYAADEEYEPSRGRRLPVLMGSVAAGVALVLIVGVALVGKLGRGPDGGAVTRPVEEIPQPQATPPPTQGTSKPTSPSQPQATALAPGPQAEGPKPAAPALPGTTEPPPSLPSAEPRRAEAGEAGRTAGQTPGAQVQGADVPRSEPPPAGFAKPRAPKAGEAKLGSMPEAEPSHAPLRPPAKTAAAEVEEHLQLGRQKLNAGDVTAAAASFARARELDPRSADALAGLGEVAFEQGRWEESVRHLQKAVKLSPERASYHLLLGQSLFRLGRYKDAADAYRKALQLNPSLQEARDLLNAAEKKLAESED